MNFINVFSFSVILCLSLVTTGCESGPDNGKDAGFGVPMQAKPSLTALSIDGLEAGLYPAFSTSVRHYAVQCGDGGAFSINFTTENTTEAKFNGLVALENVVSFQNLNIRDDIAIRVSNGDLSETYYLHCTSSSFPKLAITERSELVDDGFLLISPRMSGKSFMLILDNNAVPRFRKVIDGSITDFKRHWDGRYSYAQRTVINDFGFSDFEIVILNSKFEEQERLKTIGLNQTDNHDFLVTRDGTYMFLSYNSKQRDLSAYGLSESELTRDSVIQEQTPSGEVVFEWNSWDHVSIDNCLNHRFPDDYAHINSITIAEDRNIVASLRGCSIVLKIDRSSAETVWQLGGFDSDLTIVGDSYGEFCGQHTASLGADNSLLIFDNGGHCNGVREDTFGTFSRAVTYTIDESSAQANFTRDYSYNSSYSDYTSSGGSVFSTKNGNWLISWARGVSDITEIAPDNSVALRLEVSDGAEKLTVYRAYREYDLDLPITVNGETKFLNFSN